MSDMSELFILQNHDNLFLGRQKEWLDGRDPTGLFKTPHKDEAVNQVFEISSKDYTQRIRVVSCKVNEKGLPVIEPELLPDAQPKSASLFAEEAVTDEATVDVDEFAADDEDAADIKLDAESDQANESDETETGDNQQPLL
ncbi:hypothetical protein [Cellvibrio sp. PSBB006]|uniref:hypothetical protein n=1 Tax=Cellvibrio sp. PSBB006 TaxID=1987723 RepID=UPI0018E0412B|nr:hypothetical protein [Cellvibrio sp. PSBB006]